jgi:hypothetical protein
MDLSVVTFHSGEAVGFTPREFRSTAIEYNDSPLM